MSRADPSIRLTCIRCGLSVLLDLKPIVAAAEIATFSAAHCAHGMQLVVEFADSISDDA